MLLCFSKLPENQSGLQACRGAELYQSYGGKNEGSSDVVSDLREVLFCVCMWRFE